jgi:hypothetical protein
MWDALGLLKTLGNGSYGAFEANGGLYERVGEVHRTREGPGTSNIPGSRGRVTWDDVGGSRTAEAAGTDLQLASWGRRERCEATGRSNEGVSGRGCRVGEGTKRMTWQCVELRWRRGRLVEACEGCCVGAGTYYEAAGGSTRVRAAGDVEYAGSRGRVT